MKLHVKQNMQKQSGKLSYEEIAEIAELSIDEVKALDEKVIA